MSDLITTLKGTRQHLMNGVSHMIPVVVAGGIIFAVATMLSMSSVQQGAGVSSEGIIGILAQIGGTGLGLMVPVLSAFIAASIADRPGIAPGLIGGQLAVNVGAGFIGGILAGLLAGICAFLLKKLPLHKSIRSLKSIIIIPIVSSLVVGFTMICVIGGPCAWLLNAMTEWLTTMDGTSAIAVGAITGAMICFDLGGPLNKVAYSTGAAVVGTMVAAGQNSTFMGPISIAIAIPPIALGIESMVLRNKFTNEEREAGIGAIAMGICGITEGAISYTTASPILIPINVVSGAIGGAIAGALGVWCNAAWGGLVVLPVTSALTYVASLALGIAAHMALVFFLKRETKPAVVEEELEIEFEL
ncbi:fructose-specific PTS transporter subunit EIIC [Collinsella sp. AGMB00827]|uniref:Fructose-specific PTS transporter subunit EIIC n=1 Tax=Collinsella ureilytica TaxID=2869515 RepID=A0ABS7MIY3_9ACTN|nr:fructose-specific PTS transporter subunit EIIC [Collinsella urealyticum]MBY4797212.1 fructose-specific PTS transporter subunit EIIC [Collinsella urealyticum]